MAKPKVKVVFKESVHSFKKGTKVKLRNNDIIMIVKEVVKDNIDESFVICTWREGEEVREGRFKIFDLENIT